MSSKVILDPTRRAFVTLASMAAATIVMVDSTIANVALPHIQSSMSASQDQSIWVLTSYMIASSIATPLSGWLASRFGRKRIMMASVLGFTLASLGCGVVTNVPMLILARILQGVSGAGLLPLSQALMLDINPPERQAKAMAMYATGTMIGPLIGPTLGGWLTDSFSWRWCFLINLPIGILSLLGMGLFMRDVRSENPKRFDLFGFVILAVFLGAFQLVMDRGQSLDWFQSNEIRLEVAVMLMCGYMTIVHMMTGHNTFIRRQLFADRNYSLGCALTTLVAIVTYSAIPPMVLMMQQLLGYSAMHSGLISSPRGIGSLISMTLVARIIGKVDARWLIGMGLAMTAGGLFIQAGIALNVNEKMLVITGFVQGFGSGFVFVPMSITAFSTLAPTLRNEASAFFALTRGMGASLGLSFLQAMTITNAAQVHARLTEGVRPDNPIMALRMPEFSFSPSQSLTLFNAQISREAVMVSYIDLFWFLGVIGLAILPLVMLLRPPKPVPAATQQ